MNLTVKLTQLNGLIGDIFGYATSWVGNLIKAVIGALMMGLYQLFVVPLMLLADGIQLFFRKLAGLDTYYVGNNAESGDIVLSLINNKTIQDVFWALLILAVVLLIITTIVALVRSETQSMDDKNRKTKSKIFSESIRALFNFFMIPVVAILGIFMGNALLKALDGATQGGGSTTRVSTYIFRASAYESNRARKDETFAMDIITNHFNDLGVLTGTNQEEIASAIDSAFKNFSSIDNKKIELPDVGYFSEDLTYIHILAMQMGSFGSSEITRTCFSIYDASLVFYYYDLTSFNFLICWIGLFFAIYVMFATAIGLIKRIFKLTMLLVISPPIVAVLPLDNGTAVGKWKKAFIGSTLSAYGTVVAFNLMFLILGPLTQIELFKNSIAGIDFVFLNNIATLLIVIAALMFFKDFTKEFGEIIGAENAYEVGSKATGEIAKKVAQGAMMTVGGVGAIKNSLNAKKAAAAGDTETAKKYKEMSQARFKQAKSSFASLATNGISNEVGKIIGDSEKNSGVKDAKKELKKPGKDGRSAEQRLQQIKQDAREEKYAKREERLSRWEEKGGLRKGLAKTERGIEKVGAGVESVAKKTGGVVKGVATGAVVGALTGPVGLGVYTGSKIKKLHKANIEKRKKKEAHNKEVIDMAEGFSSEELLAEQNRLKAKLNGIEDKKSSEAKKVQGQLDELQEYIDKKDPEDMAKAETKTVETKANTRKPKDTKKRKKYNRKNWKPKK